MSEIKCLEENRWAVRVEKSAWEKGVISNDLVATGLNFFDAKVKMDQVENEFMEQGWYKGAWTLKHPERKEIIMVCVVYKPEIPIADYLDKL